MTHHLRIKEIKEETLVSDNSTFLDVEVEIRSGKNVVERKKYGFPLGTSEEEILSELRKSLELYEKELEQIAASKEEEANRQKSQEMITNLTGLEINYEQPSTKDSPKDGSQLESTASRKRGVAATRRKR